MTNTDSRNWKLEGDYFEGCNCDSICPCIFLQDPDKGYCNLTVAWHIEKGHYGTYTTGWIKCCGGFCWPLAICSLVLK